MSYNTDIKQSPYLDPGSEKLNSIESELAQKVGGERVLFKILKQIENEFDFTIIDCPPAKNTLVANALVASNFVLIPAEPEPYAYKGALVISSLVNEIKEYYNPKLEIPGIFISKSNPRRTITKAIKEAIKQETGDLLFDTDIRIDVSIPESQAAEKTILQYNPESNAVQDYTELTNELLKKIKIYEENRI